MHRRFLQEILPAALLFGALVLNISAATGADERVRVRGSIINLDGQTLNVKAREGDTVSVTLADGWTVSTVVRASIADIKPGDFLGIASLPRSAGGDGALEVLIFPPAMKGTSEGSFAWDLKPSSTMTNATVARSVKEVDGHSVTLTYQGNEKTIAIAPETPIVTFGPATPADLKPGAAVFINGEKNAAGSISARRVVVGTNGVVPPM